MLTQPDLMYLSLKSSQSIEKLENQTALVGQRGFDKSTIIGLVERFNNPLQGIVNIDNKDIRSYHLRVLRKHIILVSQEPILFVGTIRENIDYNVSHKIF